MTTIYIISDYGRLVKKGEVLQLRREMDVLKTIFPHKTEQLIIIGQIEITSAAFRHLMYRKIETIFLGSSGRFNGRIDFQTGKNIFLRKKQYQMIDDIVFCTSLSKSIVRGKLKNQLSFMQRVRRRSNEKNIFDTRILEMKRNLEMLEKAENIEQMRGFEGNGARIYFSIFRKSIITDWAVFNGRSMHPPGDNVNAVLSFLYTMILFRVDAALEAQQLDSYAGFFHSLDYGKKSLCFDLMEEYRASLCDTLAVSLFNLGILNKDDFREEVFGEENDRYPLTEQSTEEGSGQQTMFGQKKGVLLTKEGLKKVITHFERKMDDGIYYEPLMEKITYRRLIGEQIKHFKRVLTGQEVTYKPLVLK